MNIRVQVITILLLYGLSSYAQLPDSVDKAFSKIQSEKYVERVNQQVTSLDGQLTSESQKYLSGIAKEEAKLKSQLLKIDSASATSIFGNVQQQYQKLQTKFIQNSGGILSSGSVRYLPSLDSIKNTLLFLQKYQNDPLSKLSGTNVANALSNVQGLQNKLQSVGNLQAFLSQRKQYLAQQLAKFGMTSQLSKMSAEVYYYKQQINDLKASLQDPSKLQQKTIAILSQLPAYKSFMSRNSYLSKFFGQPESYNLTDSSMKGLQSRAAVQKEIQEKTSAGGPGAQQQVGQQVQSASGIISELKSKVLNGGSVGNGNPQDPGFTPNGQKTKKLWQRLEYGANLQFEPATTVLPTMADAALTLGYRLNDKTTAGVGAAYKMGLGNGLNHLAFSSQGLGLRSYLDWSMKKNLYISGGFEENYISSLYSIGQLRVSTAWQKSGLIGLSRQYQISNKLKGKVQLLFDFLSFYQVPRTQPILFRVGWSL